MAPQWKQTTIGDQATLQRGFDITKAEQRPGKVPVISSGGISSYHDTAAKKGPGVVLGRKGVVGSVYYTDGDYWPHDTTLWVKNFHGNNPRFVYYFFLGFAPCLARLDVGSANPTLNRNHVHPTSVTWPPLPEQRAIAHILGTLDDKIELNRRMNQTLEELARALFKSWFIDFDPVHRNMARKAGQTPPAPPDGLPEGLEGGALEALDRLFPDGFEDSELGRIPRGWTTRSLYESASYTNGAAYRSFDFSEDQDGLPIVKIAELKNGLTAQTRYTTKKMPQKYRIDNGDILLSWSGSPDTSLDTFLWFRGPAWLNQHIFKVKPLKPVERPFMYFLLKGLRPVLVKIARNKQTTGLGHVTAQDMKELKIVAPDLAAMKQFRDVAGPLLEKIFWTFVDSEQACSLRDTLLPKLLSGDLRVPDAERFVERGT